jgi:hypothetical protein
MPMKRGAWILGAGLAGLICATTAAQAAANTAQARLDKAWRAAISSAAVPGSGCFEADYPATQWKRVACSKAPTRLLLPAHGPSTFVVGNGNDYSAVTGTPVSTAVGSFPSIKGMKTETNFGASDTYSLQLNTSYYVSPVCNTAANPSQCRAWMQFAYSNNAPTEASGFMEVWLINYGKTCPAGWTTLSPDCVENSNGVNIPNQKLSQLKDIQVTGAAVANGNDTVTITTSKKAYAVTLPDSVVDLAGNWNTSEFNVFGDGGGTEAVFNAGTKIVVNVQMQDGSTNAPTCIVDGFTLESNNLGLNQC